MTVAKALTGDWLSILKIAGVILGAIGLPFLIKKLDDLIITQKEANETMSESISKWKEAKDELESLNSELETTRDRIEELQNKDGISLVEQEELNKLLEQEASLKR